MRYIIGSSLKISLFLLVYKPTIKMIKSVKKDTIYAVRSHNKWIRILRCQERIKVDNSIDVLSM